MMQQCAEHSQAVELFYDCQFGASIDILRGILHANPLGILIYLINN